MIVLIAGDCSRDGPSLYLGIWAYGRTWNGWFYVPSAARVDLIDTKGERQAFPAIEWTPAELAALRYVQETLGLGSVTPLSRAILIERLSEMVPLRDEAGGVMDPRSLAAHLRSFVILN